MPRPLPLADRVELNAFVLAQHLALEVDDLAAVLLHQLGLLQELPVVVVRHEADLHALLLVGRLELAVMRHRAGIALGLLAQRKHRARQLILPQREQEVALVLAQVAAPLEQRPGAVRAPLHPREVASGDILRPELVCPLDEPPELEVLVAHHARVRRAARLVFVGEVLDDLALKLRRLVNQVIRNAQLVAHGPRIRDRLRPAALVLGARHAVLRPKLERDAHHVVALLEQQRGRSGGIHSSAHAHHDACLLLLNHKPVNIRAEPKPVNGSGWP